MNWWSIELKKVAFEMISLLKVRICLRGGWTFYMKINQMYLLNYIFESAIYVKRHNSRSWNVADKQVHNISAGIILYSVCILHVDIAVKLISIPTFPHRIASRLWDVGLNGFIHRPKVYKFPFFFILSYIWWKTQHTYLIKTRSRIDLFCILDIINLYFRNY